MEGLLIILQIFHFIGLMLIKLGYYTLKIVTFRKYPKLKYEEAENKISLELLFIGVMIFVIIFLLF